jgi:hypothetical protein
MSQFTESKNTAVFTTKYVINHKVLIANVFRYDDGSWQFSGTETHLQDSDYMVVSLGQILSRDNSIEELANLPLGYWTKRNNEGDKWIIARLSNS